LLFFFSKCTSVVSAVASHLSRIAGTGVVMVPTFRSDQSEQHDKLLLKHTKTYIGTHEQGVISRTPHPSGLDYPHQFHQINITDLLLDPGGRLFPSGEALGWRITEMYTNNLVPGSGAPNCPTRPLPAVKQIIATTPTTNPALKTIIPAKLDSPSAYRIR
jgi:hypothetical protein